jgi:uncharacterized protein (DUF1501 family)
MLRRKFLSHITKAIAIPSIINGIPISSYARNPINPWLEDILVDTDRVLVLIQLDGGNDGLNTVVPLDQYDRLARGRRNVLLPESSILPLNTARSIGLHPALSGLRQLFDAGQLRIVQNVGYAEPNLSHFRSTDIWNSGADSNQSLPSGWMGRYLTYEYPNFPVGFPNIQMPDPLAIEIGQSVSLTLLGPQANTGYVVFDPSLAYNLRATDTADKAPTTPAGDQLAHVRLVAAQGRSYSQVIQNANSAVTQQRTYPDTNLANHLKIVARLIRGGLKTRVYIVKLGGFDTHSEQVVAGNTTTGIHANLLATVNDAIRAFTQDLEFLGIADRVVGMTTSEFGRRIASNGSVGTDHGEAAPLFFFGKQILGGITGKNPVLPLNPTVNDDMDFDIDFRSVYGTVLRDWFCVPAGDVPGILLHNKPFINGMFRNPANCTTSTRDRNQAAGLNLLTCTPNPFTSQVQIQVELPESEFAQLNIIDTTGRVVDQVVAATLPQGKHGINWNGSNLPSGTYYCQLITMKYQQTKPLVKI